MTWCFGEDSHFRFISYLDEVYFEVCLGTLPHSYQSFIFQIRDQFVERQAKQLMFSYALYGDGREEVNKPCPFQHLISSSEYPYMVADRRVLEQAEPQEMGREELCAIVRDKTALFYTGAGISLASNVPAMDQLNELLGLEEGEGFLFSLKSALDDPHDFAHKILSFYHACLFSSPTAAHLALKELVAFKQMRLVTENLDCLHEASGVDPYRVDAKHLKEEVEGDLSQIDYVICIGLSYDDRGFLGWYKEQNPTGKIIAIDLHQPSFLGDEDFLIIGDCQEIVPNLAKIILEVTCV